MEDTLKEMLLMHNFFEMKEKEGVILDHSMMYSPKINNMLYQFKDKRILQHFFFRVQHLYKESDSVDQVLRRKAVMYGLTRKEYFDLHD